MMDGDEDQTLPPAGASERHCSELQMDEGWEMGEKIIKICRGTEKT